MNTQPTVNRDFLCALAILATFAVSTIGNSASAELLVYEGFQYGTAGVNRAGSDLLHGQPDGIGGDIDATGLGGTWQDSTTVVPSSDLFVASGSLTFGNLVTSGNHVRGDSNLNSDIFSRPVTVSFNGLDRLYFSLLANKLQNNFSAAEGGLVLGNQVVGNARITGIGGTESGTDNTAVNGLQGFGVAPTTAGNNWTAYGWDGTSQTVGGSALTVPTNGSATHLLVGEILFNSGLGGADVYNLYNFVLTPSGRLQDGSLSLITSIEVDVDESLLNTLNLTRQVNTAYDEIRFGTNLNDVLPTPEPSTIIMAVLGALAIIGLVIRRRR